MTASGRLVGRKRIVDDLTRLAFGGAEVLVLGPLGIGKTTVLRAVAEKARRAGRPVGVAERTLGLADVTGALSRAYPAAEGHTPRAFRWSLRRAAEDRSGVLVLDHVLKAPSAMKGFLRALRETRTGVLFAVDVEEPRDHVEARALRLAFREVTVPRLGRREMRRALEAKLGEAGIALPAEERETVLDIARGRPGWLDMLLGHLRKGANRKGPIRPEILRVEVATMVAHRYMEANAARFGASREHPWSRD